MFRTSLLILLSAAVAIAADAPAYQKGTITKKFVAEAGESVHVYYELQGDRSYQLKVCGDFEDGKTVEYRVKGSNLFLRAESGKEVKCPEEIVSVDAKTVTYKKGTVEGFDTRKDYYSSGNGGVSYRKAKVYELHGPDMTYRVDYCGAFQAGQFTAGQSLDYRVDGERLYILHDGTKEYSCKIEGTRLPQDAKAPGM